MTWFTYDYRRISVWFLLCTLFAISCTKESEELIPEEEEVPDPVYKLIQSWYTMEPGDAIDTLLVNFRTQTVANISPRPIEHTFTNSSRDLLKRSSFLIDSVSVPPGLLLDSFLVRVPSNRLGENEFTLYPDMFPISRRETSQPLSNPVIEEEFRTTVQSYKELTFSGTVQERAMQSSFFAIFEDSLTGVRDTVTGKWKGTLNFGNTSMRVDERSLED